MYVGVVQAFAAHRVLWYPLFSASKLRRAPVLNRAFTNKRVFAGISATAILVRSVLG